MAETASAPRPVRAARAPRLRLDAALVERGLASGRDRARALILARDVLVDGQVALRPAAPVAAEAVIELRAAPRFVSRGGDKLDHALSRAGIEVRGCRCIDLGASTGGFTDCLLQRGAAQVVAVDVAYGELAVRLRDDPRVEVRERVNARDLPAIEPLADIGVMDVSFISAATVLPALARSVRPGGDLFVLVKPQFEAGREQVGKGGVVRDATVHAACVAKVALAAIALGLRVAGVIRSPLLGPAGNREFFLWLRVPVEAAPSAEGAS